MSSSYLDHKVFLSMDDCKVTVLMPIYNAERFLHDSIGSLLAQTCDRWKLICIDDGSTDASRSICRVLLSERLSYSVNLSGECRTCCGACACYRNSRHTEYVSILDSDDAMLQTMYE